MTESTSSNNPFETSNAAHRLAIALLRSYKNQQIDFTQAMTRISNYRRIGLLTLEQTTALQGALFQSHTIRKRRHQLEVQRRRHLVVW